MRFKGAVGGRGEVGGGRQWHLLAESVCLCVGDTCTHTQTDMLKVIFTALLTPDIDVTHDTRNNQVTKRAMSPPNLSSNQFLGGASS